jgi:hypothetical protein
MSIIPASPHLLICLGLLRAAHSTG